MATENVRYIEVYRPRTAAQAHLIKNLLENEGYTVFIENEFLQGAAGDLPMGWATCPRILVAEDQALQARAFLEHSEVDRPRDVEDAEEDETGRCLACGAELSEEQERCPKCGWSYQDEGEAE